MAAQLRDFGQLDRSSCFPVDVRLDDGTEYVVQIAAVGVHTASGVKVRWDVMGRAYLPATASNTPLVPAPQYDLDATDEPEAAEPAVSRAEKMKQDRIYLQELRAAGPSAF